MESAATGPLVSVIIPTRARLAFAERAIRSVLSQSYSNIEVIVVVDGDPPSAYERLKGFQDIRLRIIWLIESVGPGQARNIGVRRARGEWIALLDDDDEWLPEKLTRQIEVVDQGTHAQLICCQYLQTMSRRTVARPTRAPCPGQPISEYLFCEVPLFGTRLTFLQTSTWLVRRELLLRTPFDADVRMNDDTDWLLRAIHNPARQIAIVPEPLSIYHCESHQRMNTNDAENQAGEVSRRWAESRRALFTPKSLCFFFITECLPKQVAATRGWASYASTLADCRRLGAISPMVLWLFFRTTILFPALKLCLPRIVCNGLRAVQSTRALESEVG